MPVSGLKKAKAIYIHASYFDFADRVLRNTPSASRIISWRSSSTGWQSLRSRRSFFSNVFWSSTAKNHRGATTCSSSTGT